MIGRVALSILLRESGCWELMRMLAAKMIHELWVELVVGPPEGPVTETM